MAGSKFTDSASTVQLIGCIMRQPSLLNNDGKYFFSESDFTNEFHRVLFGAIFNLQTMGAQNINIKTIEDYLSKRPESLATYQSGKGAEWLTNAANAADVANFDYYYNRIKKMTLLRSYDDFGLDVKWIYDPDEIFDIKKKQQQENYLDGLTLNEIADLIDDRIVGIRRTYIDNSTDEACAIGEDIFSLLEELQQAPDIGAPMYGSLINTVTRGMREKKFYLRSAATGVGKSRTMIADACYTACSHIFNKGTGEWDSCGLELPCLFISTELELSEVQTMCLAFLSGVDENHILTNKYDIGERDRVMEAAKILQKAPLFVEEIPDFSLRDIENIIKRNIRTRGCKYVFYDYIHTSMKILEEISQRSGGVRLREDNILFLLSVKLKDICNEFGVFILSSTQLNGDWKSSDMPDQNLLRGAKSIADKIDCGMILLDVTEEDEKALKDIVSKEGYEMPNVKMSIYKNRRGSYNKCYLWMIADKSTCRFNALFCTSYDYKFIPIKESVIEF